MAAEEPTPEAVEEAGATVQTSTEQPAASRVAPDRPLGLLHQGTRYSYGFSPTGYGIWDNMSSGAPTESFPASKAGRMAGWHRYMELEPGAEDAGKTALDADNPPPEAIGAGGLRRFRGLIIFGVLVVGVVVFFLVRNGGGSSGGGGTTQAKAGTTASADISGGATVTADSLAQKTYKAQGLGTLYPLVNASWSDGTTTVSISLSQPTVGGDNSTSQVLQNSLTISTTPAGSTTPVTYSSGAGECQIHVDRLDENGFTGSYKCTAVPAQGATGTIDATGKFEAS
jgi:hypothetical protein